MWFDLFDWFVDVVGEGYDFDVCIGDEIVDYLIVCCFVMNYCVLCVLFDYLVCCGMLCLLVDFVLYDCFVIKECDYLFGVWWLIVCGEMVMVKVGGVLLMNYGEVVV